MKIPWVALHRGRFYGRASTRAVAMNLLDQPYLPGFAAVTNSNTGELWERPQGSWFKIIAAKRRPA